MKEKFVISLISQLSSNIIQLFAYYFLFIKLDVTLLGIWAFLSSIINLGFLFIDIGIDSIHFQYSGKANSSEFFGTYFFIKVLLILVNLAITIILVSALQLWSANYFILILFLLYDKILIQVIQIFLINLKTKIKIFKAELPSFFISLGKSISIIFLVFNLSLFIEPLLYLCLSNFLFDCTFIILILFLSKNEYKINKPQRDLALKYLKDVKPLLFYSIILVIAANLGQLIVDYSFGHEALGYVSFVSSYIMPILFLISTSIVTIYLPLFSLYFEKKDFTSIKRIIYIIEQYYSILFLAIILFILLNGELTISTILPKYINSIPILSIMIFIPYCIGISQPYAYLFIAGRKQNIIAKIDSFTRIFIILLMIVLIPPSIIVFQTLGFGGIGYAISQTIPWIIWSILCHYYSFKYLNIKSQKKILLHIFLAFLSFLMGSLVKNLFLSQIFKNQILLLLSSSLFIEGIFICLLFIFKELKRRDIKILIQLFRIQDYKESIFDEF